MNKVAVITGASRGIGAETAKLFAAQGYAVCINYAANDEAARQTAADITSAGGRCMIHKADIGDERAVVETNTSITPRRKAPSIR